MVSISATYVGPKRCKLEHEEGLILATDAPKDIGGNASAFSPTDLVASGLASCILTTIGMYAERHGLDITGATAFVTKEMTSDPRRIGKLPVTVVLPAALPEDIRPALERVGRLCPVHATLHPDVEAPIDYQYKSI